jgi:hypothetical protein
MGKHIPKSGSNSNKDYPNNLDIHNVTPIHLLLLGIEHLGIL